MGLFKPYAEPSDEEVCLALARYFYGLTIRIELCELRCGRTGQCADAEMARMIARAAEDAGIREVSETVDQVVDERRWQIDYLLRKYELEGSGVV